MIDQSDNKFIALANVESGARGIPLRVQAGTVTPELM